MTAPLRIGYVVRMFPRFSETFVLQEILELERQGADVTVFSLNKPNEGRFHPGLLRLKAPIVYLDDREAKKWWSWLPEEWDTLSPHRDRLWRQIEAAGLRRDGTEVDLVFWGALLASLAQKRGIQALHAHFATVASSLTYHASCITGIPYSFTAHAKDIFTQTIDRGFLTAKMNAARFVVTVSEYNRRFLIDEHLHVQADRIRVLYNGIDRTFFTPVDTALRTQPPIIFGIGRLVAKKGFADLVRACAILKARGIAFRCVIAGQGREEVPLRSLAQSSGLESEIEFAGPRHQEEVRDIMQQATVLCLPCRRDTDGNQDALPTVLLEAMSSGLPVVSTRLAGIPEIVTDGEDGLLVEPEAPEQIASALERILGSESLRRQFADAGLRKISTRFDIRRNVETLHAWLLESPLVESTKVDFAGHAQTPGGGVQ